jgi:hypothetical protein
MTKQSEPKLPMSGSDFLAEIKARHPDLDFEPKSPGEMVSYIRSRYLKPNWPHWANMAEVSLQRAVWLSLDIEPWEEGSDVDTAITGISKRTAPVMLQWYSVQLRNSLRHDYEPRMAQCLAAIDAGKLRYRGINDVIGRLMRCLISLPDFRRWGESLPAPWTFPDEFPSPHPPATPPPPSETPSAESPTNPALYTGGITCLDAEYDERLREALSPAAGEDEKPLGTRERATLRRVIRALIAIAGDRLPEGKETTIIEAQLSALGFAGPKTETIRAAVKAAKAEKTDSP